MSASRRTRMADALVAAGALRTEAWRRAFADVPRHTFVPDFYRVDRSAFPTAYTPVHPGDPGWLEELYADVPLVTQLDGRDIAEGDTEIVTGIPTSSSTMPSLMARMLEHLDVEDGHRVLEAGAGTGYNAALLCHRVGDTAVTTVDIDPGLCEAAARRLARSGYAPTVLTGDAALGHPGGALFDRIIATYAVRGIPRSWIEQTRPGGQILATLESPAFNGYALAKVTVGEDGTAVGRLLPDDASFMPSRTDVGDMGPAWTLVADRGPGEVRPAGMDTGFLRSPDAAFLVGLAMPGVAFWYEASGDVPAMRLARPGDGSWAAHDPNTGIVEQGGPGRLWDQLEDALQVWDEQGRPPRGAWLLRADDSGQFLHLPGAACTLLLPHP